MANQPLAEVFGFPIDDLSEQAIHHRQNRLCPYHNRIAECTKDKANDPLGVCSVFDTRGNIAITCPVRLRQDWLIVQHAAQFFFPAGSRWAALSEIQLNDQYGVSAGNIDLALVAYNEQGEITDFGSLEVQAVYVSGNVRQPFELFMNDPENYIDLQPSLPNRPRPDYLSSSRKRLVPQLLYKGSILKEWGKKQAVALHSEFYKTLPSFPEVNPEEADMVWLIYDLVLEPEGHQYQLKLSHSVYTLFKPALDRIITPDLGRIEDFVSHLQRRLHGKLDGSDLA